MLKRITESNIRQYYIEIKKTVLKLYFRAVFNFIVNETVCVFDKFDKFI